MKGSVRKRYNNAWSYRIDLGFVDGKRKQVEKGGFKTEREATKAMQDVLYHLNNTGDYVENKKISFHTVYEEFIEREGKATRAYATLKKYDSLYRNHIKDEFGPLYVYQISDTMIIDFLNQKRIKYSEEYVKGMYKFFNVILRYAHDHKYTKKNVMDLVPPPPDPRHVGDIVTYNRKELEQMIERIESTRSKIAFQLGLQAGLRESECFALTWSDIDFEKKKIKVCKQLLYQDKQWCFAPLKTVNSYRSVNITAEFAQYLADMKMQHDAERKLYGDGYKRNFVTDRREPKKEEVIEVPDFINVKANGEMLTTNGAKFLARIIKKDLGIHFKFHNLRHPYVKHTTKIFSLRLMDFQAQAYPDARRKTRGACQLHQGGQSRSPVRLLCNRKQLSCLPPQSKMSRILYAISMRLSGYTSTRSISSSASSVVSASASKIALDASFRLSCRACSSCFCFACANTAA